MLTFILLTFVAYLSIDFSVYWLGNKEVTHFSEIFSHHFKMLPIYLIANVLLTVGFLYGVGKEINPMVLLVYSIIIWAISLMIVAVVLYKIYPNALSLLGIVIIVAGALLVNFSVKH